jgi:hypothetical protein
VTRSPGVAATKLEFQKKDSPFTGIRAAVTSEEALPPMTPTSVTVHYFESGSYRKMTIGMQRPTYFDKLVVARVQEILPALQMPSIRIESLRSAARYAYHASLQLNGAMRTPLTYDEPVLDLRAVEPNNISHLMFDAIPYCLRARAAAGPDTVFLFRKIAPLFTALLEIFDIVPRYEPRKVAANVVKLRGARGLAVFNLIDTFDCTAFSFFPDTYLPFDFSTTTGFDRIFLARHGPRSLLNHDEIEPVTAAHGYRTVFMEDYSLRDQLSIGARARHVVALHGAAMSLLAVNRGIESIIEILPPHNQPAFFPVALGPRVRRYEQIIPDFDPAVMHSWPESVRFKDLPFSVDATLLAKLLAEIH